MFVQQSSETPRLLVAGKGNFWQFQWEVSESGEFFSRWKKFPLPLSAVVCFICLWIATWPCNEDVPRSVAGMGDLALARSSLNVTVLACADSVSVRQAALNLNKNDGIIGEWMVIFKCWFIWINESICLCLCLKVQTMWWSPTQSVKKTTTPVSEVRSAALGAFHIPSATHHTPTLAYRHYRRRQQMEDGQTMYISTADCDHSPGDIKGRCRFWDKRAFPQQTKFRVIEASCRR